MTNISPEEARKRQDRLNALVAKLDTMRERDCDYTPTVHPTGKDNSITKEDAKRADDSCPICQEIAQAQAAWEVLTVECTVKGGLIDDVYVDSPEHSTHVRCQGTSRIPWNISEPPRTDGAVRGMVIEAMELLEMDEQVCRMVKPNYDYWDEQVPAVLWGVDPQALMQAFQAALPKATT